jgi:hypothetical protein
LLQATPEMTVAFAFVVSGAGVLVDAMPVKPPQIELHSHVATLPLHQPAANNPNGMVLSGSRIARSACRMTAFNLDRRTS